VLRDHSAVTAGSGPEGVRNRPGRVQSGVERAPNRVKSGPKPGKRGSFLDPLRAVLRAWHRKVARIAWENREIAPGEPPKRAYSYKSHICMDLTGVSIRSLRSEWIKALRENNLRQKVVLSACIYVFQNLLYSLSDYLASAVAAATSPAARRAGGLPSVPSPS
jgi:hypothetical protein